MDVFLVNLQNCGFYAFFLKKSIDFSGSRASAIKFFESHHAFFFRKKSGEAIYTAFSSTSLGDFCSSFT